MPVISVNSSFQNQRITIIYFIQIDSVVLLWKQQTERVAFDFVMLTLYRMLVFADSFLLNKILLIKIFFYSVAAKNIRYSNVCDATYVNNHCMSTLTILRNNKKPNSKRDSLSLNWAFYYFKHKITTLLISVRQSWRTLRYMYTNFLCDYWKATCRSHMKSGLYL